MHKNARLTPKGRELMLGRLEAASISAMSLRRWGCH